MKNNKVLIIVAVVLINILAVYMIGQSFLGKASEYDKAVSEAQTFVEQKLYSKAIDKYNEALNHEDTIELRIEMLDVIQQGLDFGEFTDLNKLYDSAEEMVEMYPDNVTAYEKLCGIYLENGEYEDCVEMLLQAKGLKIKSDTLSAITEEVRYMYDLDYTTYVNVSQLYGNSYLIELEDNKYAYLNKEGVNAFSQSFIEASSFNLGYAYIKTTDKEGNLISTIINGSGQRQIYLPEVEYSSGVGQANTADGQDLLLISGNVGDRYKYYTLDGKETLEEYYFAGRFRNNVAAVQESEGEWYLINGQGEKILDTAFEDVILNEFDECAAKGNIFAKSEGKYRMYTSKGEQIGDFECDDAKSFVDGYAAFKSNDLWGYVDYNGNVVIAPQYEDANSFSCGIAAVKMGEYYNYINTSAEIVIEGNFEEAGFFGANGMLYVKVNGRCACLKMYYKENA